MADDSLHITVSYSGKEKRVPLAVRPSLELSDFDVDQAELELCGIVCHLFNIPVEAAFSLHEAESSRILTKESFRDPSYIQRFPTHWYLTVEKTAAEVGEEEEEGEKLEPTSAFDQYSEGLSDLEETFPSLAELSAGDVKYQSIQLTADSNGLFGIILRYFSIHPVPPPADCREFEGSQNSQQSTGSADILSTTFVHQLEGVGQEAGLQRGDTVHMINGESIIRSNYSEIQDLLGQCGSVISLMVLPKEHDDLQFLYPQYTEGAPGDFSSGDERVIIRDIPVIVGSGSSMPEEAGLEVEGREPLSIYSFKGSGSSLDHTHSNSSNEHLHQDDQLINCSIHDIPVQSPASSRTSFHWYNKSGTGSNSQLDRLDENTTYDPPSWRPVANGDTSYDNDSVEEDPSWYHDPGEGLESVSQQVQELAMRDRVFRAHSQDSGVIHRVGLLSSGEEGSSNSQPMWAEDLGVVRIGRHSKKSLEMLTSLTTAAPPPHGMRRIHSDDLVGHMTRDSAMAAGEGRRRHSVQPNTDKNVTPTAKAPPTSFQGADSLPALPPARERPRKATRSYSSQRKQLHQSRTRVTDSNAAAKTAEILRRNLSQPMVGGMEGERGGHEQRFHSESGSIGHSISPVLQDEREVDSSPDQSSITPTIKVASEEPQHVVGEGSHTLRYGETTPPMSPRRFQSATLDPRSSRPGPAHPGPAHPGNYKDQIAPLLLGPASRRLPIVKSTSAQTPYGTEVVRERNIDEAVAASQGGSLSLSVQPGVGSRSFSMQDTESEVTGRVGLFSPTFTGRRHSHYEERASRNQVPCAGMLYKKQISEGQGRKSSGRSWKPFYTILVGSHMVFYKDKKDADANKPCEEPPLEVVPARADLTHSYTKRRNVFRVISGQGAEFLLQCETSESMLHWVTTITRLNGGVKMVEQAAPKSANFLSPGSPLSSRRDSSPLPLGPAQPGRGRKKGLGLRSLKSLYKNKKGVGSIPSFGQLLADCPVSSDTKSVPLVVEMCVKEVEEQGLDVEGLYRKPGQRSIIKNMVADIDKGQFECEDYGDIHTIGSLLKKFFQDLQDPLIPSDRYKEFLMVVREGQRESDQVTRLRGLVFHLPTAHYHTLRYLTSHLNKVAQHSEENKMVLRNVAMVFGPTLMLPTGSEELDLAAMNCTFTVIELICKHWKNIFDADLCYEEVAQERVRERERLKAEAQAESGGLGPAQRTSSDPAVNSLKVKKDTALFNASPRMVRRIKNQFTSSSSSSSSRRTPDRNSYSGGETLFSTSLPAARKHHNRSETLPSPNPMAPAFLSPSQPTPGGKWGRAGSSGTLQSARPRETGGYVGDLNPHSRYRVREEERREHSSIWKEQQRGRGSERQSRSQMLSSHPPPPPLAHQKELLTSYQQKHPHTLPYHHHSHSSPSHEALHRSTTLPASPEHRAHSSHMRAPPPSHAPSSPGPRRKISYNLAVGEGYGYQHNVHHRRLSDQLPYQDELREAEFSHSYAPPSSAHSSNHSGKSGSQFAGSRDQPLYGQQRRDQGQRLHPKSYH